MISEIRFLLCCVFCVRFLCASEIPFLSEHEEKLISHVKTSISLSNQGISKLPPEALQVVGMSSPKVRHFLNNLCSLPSAGYLEIGTWKGSTWIAGLYENFPSMSFAIAVDDWSEFEGSYEAFQRNCQQFLAGYNYRMYQQDAFKVDLNSNFPAPVNIYFYDGRHGALDQEMAFTYYNDVLDDVFVAVVDDWNWVEVKNGTYSAFQKLNYEILFQEELPARDNGDIENWWNGLYVAVIRKNPSLKIEK